MRIKPKRRTRKVKRLRFNWVGLQLRSVTVDLGWFGSGVLWERKR